MLNDPVIPVSWGELFDKITILNIKKRRINDVEKLLLIERELELLLNVSNSITMTKDIQDDISHLEKINDELWDIEDGKRNAEKTKTFDERFINLARNVYLKNDERARIKLKINIKLNSNIVEVKSHEGFVIEKTVDGK